MGLSSHGHGNGKRRIFKIFCCVPCILYDPPLSYHTSRKLDIYPKDQETVALLRSQEAAQASELSTAKQVPLFIVF